MTLSKKELTEIYAGEIATLEEFAALHRRKGDRPETWFNQQDRRLAAHRQIYHWLKQAAERDRKAEVQDG